MAVRSPPLARHLALHTSVLAALFALGGCEAADPPGQARPTASARVNEAPPAPVRAAPPPAAAAAETWNAAQIDWQPYEAGLAKARAQSKPVCLVLYTGWCPHCKNYSHVFDDKRVVDRARSFVMIRANADEQPEVAGKYAPDGGYVPRTLFFASDGTLAADVQAPRPQYKYFYDEKDPASVLGGMDAALTKLVPKKK